MYPLRIDGMAAAVQPAVGTDAVPTMSANAIRHVGRIWPASGDEYAFENMREDVTTGSLIEAEPGTPQGHMISFSMSVEMKGAGAAYASGTPVRPEIDPLLVACGLLRTHDDTVSSESVEYTLADDEHEVASVYLWSAGQVMKLVDCAANAVGEFNAGQLARMNFTISGIVTEISQEALPVATYDDVESPAIVNAGFAITPSGGSAWSPNFSAFQLDLGNNVVRLDDGNSANGIERFAIGSRAPRLTLNARVPAFSAYNPNTLRAANTLQELACTLGSTQYNRFDIESTDMRLVGRPGRQEDNEFAAYALTYMLRDLALRAD